MSIVRVCVFIGAGSALALAAAGCPRSSSASESETAPAEAATGAAGAEGKASAEKRGSPDGDDAAQHRSGVESGGAEEEVFAAEEVDGAYCESDWVEDKAFSKDVTEACAEHWVQYGYGAPIEREGTLTLDPLPGAPIATEFTPADFERLAERVREVCGERCEAKDGWDADEIDWRMLRAAEYFEAEANNLRSTFCHARMESLEPLLETILEGRAVSEDDLDGWNAVALWQLRNAVFARHGRPFEHPALQALFYEGEGLNLEPDPDYDDERLTEIDRDNVRRILEREEAQRREHSRKGS